MAIDRWESLTVHGSPAKIDGELLSRLGNDGWQVMRLVEHRKTWGNTALIGVVTGITVYLQRASSTAYERSRSRWIEWLSEQDGGTDIDWGRPYKLSAS